MKYILKKNCTEAHVRAFYLRLTKDDPDLAYYSGQPLSTCLWVEVMSKKVVTFETVRSNKNCGPIG